VRNPTANADAKREAAIAEACKLLEPLTKPARSWSIVNWNQAGSDRRTSRRDLHDAAVEFLIALLDPAPPDDIQPETYDPRPQQAADEFLGVIAPIVRKAVLPALRLPPPPKRKGRRAPKRKGPPGILVRDRWIAAVVAKLCEEHKLDPYRNPLSEHRCNGCSVVAEALKRLGIGLSESSVRQIYAKHG
jgi:hypothetical protein